MKVESIKVSRQHKDCESANWAQERPDEAPLERALMNMQKGHNKSKWKSFLDLLITLCRLSVLFETFQS